MRLTRMLNAALLALTLAGCGQATLSGTTAPSSHHGSSSALAIPDTSWADPMTLSTADDPAVLPGAPATNPGGTEVPGIKIVNFRQVSPILYRGGLPSKQDLVDLKKLGVKTDIDLMGDIPGLDTYMVSREKRWAKEAGVNFVQVKIPTGKIPGKRKIAQADAEAFLRVVLDPANQPCFVHCLHGRDRTGTMVAVYRMTKDGYTNQQALDEMKSFGFDPSDYPSLASFVQAFKASRPTVAAQ
jgi:protein tyrosine phosphatase (PTP) superfamily phosphohydrolase (DUF442 family)